MTVLEILRLLKVNLEFVITSERGHIGEEAREGDIASLVANQYPHRSCVQNISLSQCSHHRRLEDVEVSGRDWHDVGPVHVLETESTQRHDKVVSHLRRFVYNRIRRSMITAGHKLRKGAGVA